MVTQNLGMPSGLNCFNQEQMTQRLLVGEVGIIDLL